MVANYHTDHPRRLVHKIWELLRKENTELQVYLGTESSSFLSEFTMEENRNDYQYASLYSFSQYSRFDLLIISIGTFSIYQSRISVKELLDHLPKVPTILMETDLAPENGIFLITDNYQGIEFVLDHLICKHNLSRIGFLTGPDSNHDAEERFRAYRETLQKYGIPVLEQRIRHGDYSEHVDALVEDLLDENPDLEAIVSSNDEMAVSVYRVCEKRGLVVGKDIAVTGFDDMEMAQYMHPPLTTVCQDYDLCAEKAVEKALKILKGEPVNSERLFAPFVRRVSCGCAVLPGLNPGAAEEESPRNLFQSSKKLTDLQHHTWIGALMMRELLLETADTLKFFERMGMILSFLQTKSSYIYLFNTPRVVDEGSIPELPETIRLFLEQSGQEYRAYDSDTAPFIRKNTDSPPGRHTGGSFFTFLLFYDKYQYGTLNVEITPPEADFYYMLSLEIGSSLRYHFISLEQRRYRDELQAVARHDSLTGLYNRSGFTRAASELMSSNDTGRLAMFMGDLDHLKQINDSFGHPEGDAAIITAANILKEALGEDAALARTGGDEFMAVFPIGSEKEIREKTAQIKELCGQYNETSGKPYYIGISVGSVSFHGSKYTNLKNVIKRADAKLYEAKQSRMESVIRTSSAL